MKSKVYAAFLSIMVACLFVACGDSKDSKSNTEAPKETKQDTLKLQTYTSKLASELLKIGEDEERFYFAKGVLGGDDVRAHIEFVHDGGEQNNMLLYLSIYGKSGVLYDGAIHQAEIGLDSGALVLKGMLDPNKEFALKQDMSLALSEIDILSGRANECTGSDETHKVCFNSILTRAFVPSFSHGVDSQNKINKLLAQNVEGQSKEELKANLSKQAKKIVESAGKLEYNKEETESIRVMYVDSKILVLQHTGYTYEGGAHGMSAVYAEIYDIENVTKLSSDMNTLFNPQNNAQLLQILDKKLAANTSKFELFNEALPLKELPRTFFIGEDGVSFVWQPYEIAPYSSGDITIVVPYSELKDLIDSNSPLAYKFY